MHKSKLLGFASLIVFQLCLFSPWTQATQLVGIDKNTGQYGEGFVGDVTGDGVDDFIVCTGDYNTPPKSGCVPGDPYSGDAECDGKPVGAVAIFKSTLAGISPISRADIIITGSLRDNIASQCDLLPDVNGDGVSDIAIKTQSNLVILFGSSSLSSGTLISKLDIIRPARMLGGSSSSDPYDPYSSSASSSGSSSSDPYDPYSSSVSSSGSSSSDPYDPYSSSASSSGSHRGRFLPEIDGLGQAIKISKADTTSSTTPVNGEFDSIKNAGDLNDDGLSDVIISYTVNGRNDIDAKILYGSTSLASMTDEDLADFYYESGLYTAAESTSSVSAAGDINGDGFDDVVIGYSTENLAFIVLGQSAEYSIGNDLSSMITLTGRDGSFGSTVAGVGDINGDGFDDVAIGAPLSNIGRKSHNGTVFLFEGSAAPASATYTSAFAFIGAGSSDKIGQSLSTAGDTNGDGYDDFAIGSQHLTKGSLVDVGGVYIVYGKASLSGINFSARPTGSDFTLISPSPSADDQFGRYVWSNGLDINSDGKSDLVVSEPGKSSVRIVLSK